MLANPNLSSAIKLQTEMVFVSNLSHNDAINHLRAMYENADNNSKQKQEVYFALCERGEAFITDATPIENWSEEYTFTRDLRRAVYAPTPTQRAAANTQL